jgi:hypothetical protein
MRSHTRSVARPVVVLSLAAVVLGAACRKEPEQQEAQYPPQQYQNQYPPQQQQYPPQQQYPSGYTQPAAQPPPGGVPCSTDADPQCPFGRCIAGKCGGCASAEHCKPGAACVATPVGMTCFPGGMPGAPAQ